MRERHRMMFLKLKSHFKFGGIMRSSYSNQDTESSEGIRIRKKAGDLTEDIGSRMDLEEFTFKHV